MKKIILNEAQLQKLVDVFTYTPRELIDNALNREEEIPELSIQSKAGTMQEAIKYYQDTTEGTEEERAEERQMIIFADDEENFVNFILLYVAEDKESDELILAIRKMASIILGG